MITSSERKIIFILPPVRHKGDKFHVPIVSPAPLPFKSGCSHYWLVAEINMVAVFSWTYSITKSSTTIKFYNYN